jgi:4-amino-4-deoxy-L-arabinose transferase-like glycosyltransferase
MPLHMDKTSANLRFRFCVYFLGVFGVLALAHFPLLGLPYYWDEAGYYIPAALDFLHYGHLIPQSTVPTGHTPLVMICLAAAWRIAGYAPYITRLVMVGFAAGTLVALYTLGRTVTRRETALWACVLLALSPLYFAQSSLAFLDLPAALTTTVAIWALLQRRMGVFAAAASLAVLTKETAVVIVPVALFFFWWRRKNLRKSDWLSLAAPVVALGCWAVYYHHATGYWTGNPQYLQYNLYSTLKPGRIALTLLRRLYQVFIAGFNWLFVVIALFGRRRMIRAQAGTAETLKQPEGAPRMQTEREFFLLTTLLTAAYIALLSVVGGAVLQRYLLPIFPCFYLALTMLADRLPLVAMRVGLVLVCAAFVASWFINPPYPFAYENNLAYADFIRLHQEAAQWLSAQQGNPRVLTAWPATDELSHPELGYVKKPMRVVGIQNFSPPAFRGVSDSSFDLVYLYSRSWDPPDNWLRRYRFLARLNTYSPPIVPGFVAFRFDLRPVAVFRRRGQWVTIFAKKQSLPSATSWNFRRNNCTDCLTAIDSFVAR